MPVDNPALSLNINPTKLKSNYTTIFTCGKTNPVSKKIFFWKNVILTESRLGDSQSAGIFWPPVDDVGREVILISVFL
jgi:hypothetical protein